MATPHTRTHTKKVRSRQGKDLWPGGRSTAGQNTGQGRREPGRDSHIPDSRECFPKVDLAAIEFPARRRSSLVHRILIVHPPLPYSLPCLYPRPPSPFFALLLFLLLFSLSLFFFVSLSLFYVSLPLIRRGSTLINREEKEKDDHNSESYKRKCRNKASVV